MKEEQKTKKVTAPHDRGYKRSLSTPREFLHFIQKYIGANWMMELEENQLTLCDKEFIEKDYEGKEADLLYKIIRKDGQEIFIFILQELQSYVDYTMIFRILIYVVNTLLKYFLNADKKERERKAFRLPAIIPVVFYNGEDKWTAAKSLREYQINGGVFGNYILNLEYYLIDLAEIKEEYILSTNTVLDNIMYCDKFRVKMELAEAVREAYQRVSELSAQEKEEFHNWVKYILLAVCDNKEAVVEEILTWAGNGEDDMAFKYNIVRAFEKEREEGKIEGKIEGKQESIIDFLEEYGMISEELKGKIISQKDEEIIKKWLKLAISVSSVEEFSEKMDNA